MKNQKGITLISLIITITVMAILAGTTLFVSMNRFKSNNLRKMYNDITLLNDKIENYYLKYGGLPVLRQNENLVTYTYSELNFNKNTKDNANYYIIDLQAIGNITLNYGKEGYEHPNTSDDVYILNEKTHTVYYVKGIESKNEIVYHSLSFDDSGSIESVGVTKPEINILNKGNEFFDIEIIPGKDNISGVAKTEYKITTTDLAHNVTEGETTEISQRTVISNLSVNKAHDIQVTTTSNNESHTSTTTNKNLNGFIKNLNIGDYVNYSAVLPDVTLTNDSQLITHLTTYSGNTDTSQNTTSTITQEKNLQWRILDIKEGKIRLISSKPTTSKIRLYSYNGYNNAVYLLDEACNVLYSSNKGKSQNLKIEDIEDKIDSTQYNYNNYTNYYNNAKVISYNEEKEYMSSIDFPNIYRQEEGCKKIDNQNNVGALRQSEQESLIDGKSTATTSLKMKQTHWFLRNVEERHFIDSRYYNIFIISKTYQSDSSYWLSSRSLDYKSEEEIYFRVRMVHEDYINSNTLFGLNNIENGITFAFRPVVILNSEEEIGEKVDDVWQIQ